MNRSNSELKNEKLQILRNNHPDKNSFIITTTKKKMLDFSMMRNFAASQRHLRMSLLWKKITVKLPLLGEGAPYQL